MPTMAMMKWMVSAFLCLVALTRYTTVGCADCYRKHPQQIYCESDFVFHMEVTTVTRSMSVPGSRTQSHNLISGRMIGNLKASASGSGKTVEFYSPSSICGTWFEKGAEYVVVGSFIETEDGEIYLDHGSCDYAKKWDELSDRQQKGFETKYKRLCDCTILPIRSISNQKVSDFSNGPGYQGANSYWTPVDCYYNPYKSKMFQDDDCEEEYGFCKPANDGTCSWQLTDDYVTCFAMREEYVQLEENMYAITDIEQCKLLPRRERKKCKKQVKANLATYDIY